MTRPASRRFRLPRRIRATTAGKVFLLLTLGVGAAAINTGNNLLYLALCANLALIILSGVLSEASLSGTSLSLRAASEAFAGTEAFLAVTCNGKGKRFPGMSLSAAFRIGGEAVTVRFPDIPPGGSATRIVPFLPARRGLVRGTDGALSTRFPFSLFEKSMDVAVPAEFLVYPRPAPPGEGERGSPETAPAENPLLAGRVGAFPRGTREHLPADPVRDIHWKASARAGRWMVKERENESAAAVELVLAPSATRDEFERRVRALCGAVLDLERRGVPYRLRLGDGASVAAPGADRREAALAALATVRFEGPFPPGDGGRP